MFTAEEIQFMKDLGLDFDFDNLSDDNWCDMEEIVGDKLVWETSEKEPQNAAVFMCEAIMRKIPK